METDLTGRIEAADIHCSLADVHAYGVEQHDERLSESGMVEELVAARNLLVSVREDLGPDIRSKASADLLGKCLGLYVAVEVRGKEF